MRKLFFKKGFTLAEVMVVLTVIGILTAILLPTAFHATPDENVMKLKKGNATLFNIIRELVSSGQYYADGDLGKKPDGSLVSSAKYFCETFADLISTRSVNCSSANNGQLHIHLSTTDGVDNLPDAKQYADNVCKNYQRDDIVAGDGVTYWEASPYNHFASKWTNESGQEDQNRLYGTVGYWHCEGHTASNGDPVFDAACPFDPIYKIFCMDVDGINNGEDPFGYGIRADGKILTGARADEWLKKSFQNKD